MADLTIGDTLAGIAAGAAGAAIVAGMVSAMAGRWRSAEYAAAKTDPVSLPAWLPAVEVSDHPIERQQHDRAMSEELKLRHSSAKALQDQSFAQLIAASSTLLAAFIVTTLSLTVGRSSALLHICSAAFDVVALTIAYLAFRRSGTTRAAWLRERAVTEFVRQWLATDYLFSPVGPGITRQVAELIDRIESAISPHPDQLMGDVVRLGSERIESIRTMLSARKPTDDALADYYVKRVRRQVSWFTTSLHRIDRGHHRRGKLIALAFLGAILAAFVKLVALSLHLEQLSDIALTILLILIGLSGASSSAYLGQNLRSLKHRYAQQLRTIDAWAENAVEDGLLARVDGREAANDRAIARDILAFERLMFFELVDWLAISFDDAMELAPS